MQKLVKPKEQPEKKKHMKIYFFIKIKQILNERKS